MAWRLVGPERYPLARRSLFYLFSYLLILGLGLWLVPMRTLDLLGATGNYEPVFPRVCGMFMIGLAMITGVLIGKRLDILYPGVVAVRAFFSLSFLAFHHLYDDPVFFVFFGLVFAGALLTTLCLWIDRRRELASRS